MYGTYRLYKTYRTYRTYKAYKKPKINLQGKINGHVPGVAGTGSLTVKVLPFPSELET